ncbi:MAG: hypothetical protein KKE89_07785 [Actinobacteria bacterium]|nr:hypothetical protein [Actinomycetota bacterium]
MSDETLSRIAGWCEAEDDLSIDGTTITVAGDPALELAVEIGGDALALNHTHTVPHAPHGFSDGAIEMLGRRGSMVTGEVATGANSTDVHIRYPIYLDGLNRQSFLVGVREITGTVDGLDRLTASAAASPEEHPTREIPAGPTPPPSQPEPKPAAAPAPWAPTHRVPATGMAAWSSPDPSVAPVANLSPGVLLRVDEQRGAWASVTGSNGWTGWVDARILPPIGPAASPAGPSWSAPSATRPAAGSPFPIGSPVGLLGGILMVAATFLAWGHWTFVKALDLSVASVYPLSEWFTWSQPRVGMVLLAAGAAAIAASLIPAIRPGLRVLAGLLAVWMSAGLLVTALVNGAAVSDLLDHQLTGLYVAFVGGILAMMPSTAR